MFSVICPTYNSSSFIAKTLNSVLNQQFLNYEIILSDDGSTDDTLKILEKYSSLFQEKKIKCTILKNEHHGPGYARNRGLETSKFDWISFIDSDDLWTEDKLSKVYKCIIENQKFNCILHRQFHKTKKRKYTKFNFDKYYDPKKPIHRQIFTSNFLSTSTVTIRKALIFNAGLFNEEYQNAQDYDLWLKIGNNLNIEILKEYLGTYVSRDGNISSRSYILRLPNVLKIINKNKKKVSSTLYIYKLIRIFLSLEWIKLHHFSIKKFF